MSSKSCCLCYIDKNVSIRTNCWGDVYRDYCRQCARKYNFGLNGCPFCRGKHTHEKELIESSFGNHIPLSILKENPAFYIADYLSETPQYNLKYKTVLRLMNSMTADQVLQYGELVGYSS